MPDLPRLAHIGAGRFSRAAHGPMIRRLAGGATPRLALDGVSDVDESRPERAREFCRDFGYRAAYGGVRALMAGVRPDLLVCVVDVSRTAAVVADLLPTRIPLLVEKPPGESAADAAALASLSRACGTLHYVAFNRRRVPAVEAARRWLGRHGPPRRALAEMLRQGRTNRNFAVATGIHVVDTLRHLAGEVAWMHAASLTTGPSSRDYHASAMFDSGCRGDIVLSMDAAVTRERYCFEYDDATCVEVTMSAPYSDPSIWAGLRVTRGGRVLVAEPAPADPLDAIGMAGVYRAFLGAVATGRAPDCSLTDAWQSMLVAEGLERGGFERVRP